MAGYTHSVGGTNWRFESLREVMAKASPARSGDFLAEVATLSGLQIDVDGASNLPWWSRSIDSNYLTGKRVFCELAELIGRRCGCRVFGGVVLLKGGPYGQAAARNRANTAPFRVNRLKNRIH